MRSPGNFANPQGWNIKSWTVERTGEIPADAFPEQSLLLIGVVPPMNCTLAWLNGNQQLCSIKSLPYQPETGTLEALEFPVSFGEPRLTVCSKVMLSFDDKGRLNGTLEALGREGNDGNVGTFVAEANPGSTPDET